MPSSPRASRLFIASVGMGGALVGALAVALLPGALAQSSTTPAARTSSERFIPLGAVSAPATSPPPVISAWFIDSQKQAVVLCSREGGGTPSNMAFRISCISSPY
jgi:hypothetical protein